MLNFLPNENFTSKTLVFVRYKPFYLCCEFRKQTKKICNTYLLIYIKTTQQNKQQVSFVLCQKSIKIN